MENIVKMLSKNYSNANNGMFSTVAIIIIGENRAITQFLWFQFKEHIVETITDSQSKPWKIFLSKTKETLIVCFEEKRR